ncbi:uncharacterized protein PV06_06114 [Exophiala oligosperma]|uniref:N-acetyltransferase domain-containing protein n=1 Tax=Exophiala oligosperma TaxID=215243 RepID=A0A0D2BYP5_9EURO|nr:uncharacterized protein PV06_06114 [Exophiala oligosperma]KIW42577.1 hypothetical protein PV06_06114 [Exophiala oligosperma]
MATVTDTDTDTLDVALPTGANLSTGSLLTPQPREANGGFSGSKSPTPVPTTPPPPMTTSRSEYYQDRLADISSRATVTDPMNVIFAQDKSGPSTVVTAELLYPAARARVAAKVGAGSFVAEAADFAAVVCWEPPEAVAPLVSETELQEMAKARPVFSRFVRDMQDFKVATFGTSQAYWNMSLMARDPDRNDKGAVRAVIEPFVARAKRDGRPIWLCAANERARDVYAHFGFRVVGVIYSALDPKDDDANRNGEGQENKKGVKTWCMCCNWPVQSVTERESQSAYEYEAMYRSRNGDGNRSGSGSGNESGV